METVKLPSAKVLLPVIGGVVLIVLLAFGRSLTQDFAPLDDDLLITHNLAVRGVTTENLHTVFTTYDPELYIPLTFVSYQINYLVGGLQPWTYHMTNILLHAGNALLVMWLLFLLTKKTWLSLFAGLLFAVHPLNTEAVVWLAGRKDLLSTMFFLIAFVTYLQYRRRGDSRIAPTNAYCLSIIFFTFALLSKVMAMTLPAVLLLTDIAIDRRKWGWKMLVDKIPYAIFSGIFLVIATAGKERILAQHSMLETALMAAKSTVFYLEKFLVPIRLGVFYPYRGEISLLLPAFVIPVVIMIILAGLTVFSLKKTRGVMFGTAFFLITLAPTFINFHKGGEMYFASDRYPYLPQVGLLFLVILAANAVHEFFPRAWKAVLGVAVVALLCGLSFFQTKIWDSARSLFANTLTMYPQSVAARSALATMDKNEGRYEQAIKLIRDGLGYGDDVRLRMALGTVYAKIGRVEDATDQFMQAMKLDPLNPEPLVALGVLDEYNKKIPEAMEKYRKAVSMDSSYVSARNKLGSLLLEEGKAAEAEEQFRAALKWNPNAEGVLYNMSLILDAQGKGGDALENLEKAHALSPDDPRIMVALAEHLLERDAGRARTLLEQVLRMDPGNQEAQALLRSLDTP